MSHTIEVGNDQDAERNEWNASRSAGLPSGTSPEGGQGPDPKQPKTGEKRLIGSGYDRETKELVAALLAGGYTPAALAVALTVDDDTLRRWTRGVRASHLARKLMRCLLVLRRLAPGLLVGVSEGSVDDLIGRIDALTVRHLTPLDVEREAVSLERKRLRLHWKDGTEVGS